MPAGRFYRFQIMPQARLTPSGVFGMEIANRLAKQRVNERY
jgi:hypothetical protein